MSGKKDHGLKQHGLPDDAIEAGHEFIEEVEEEARHGENACSKPSMESQQKKGGNLEGMQPGKQTGQENAGKKT
ncbi:hypothetical protein LY76DRAFT_597715 [Colletotrichum caudatum]|nr:hypothetical protein LY76DRAFT_597715 [Colletotrichum caudatum]